jgi:hypothetical protein
MQTRKEQLIQLIDEARAEMDDALSNIDQNRQIYTIWSVKELVAHLVGWYDVVIESIKAHAQGHIPATPTTLGIDHYNAQTVADQKMLPYEHIYNKRHLLLDQIKQAILDLTSERLDAEMVFPWGPQGTLLQLVTILSEHKKEHAADLRKL